MIIAWMTTIEGLLLSVGVLVAVCDADAIACCIGANCRRLKVTDEGSEHNIVELRDTNTY